MKRTMAVVASATLLSLGVAAPAFAAPSGLPCVQMDGRCVPLENIDVNDDIYIVQTPNGSARGFDDFSAFAAYQSSTYGLSFDSESELLSVDGGNDASEQTDPEEPEEPEEPTDECIRWCPDDDSHNSNDGSGENDGEDDSDGEDDGDSEDGPRFVMAREAVAGTFFDRSNRTGESFMLAPGDFISDLKKLPRVSGGTWDNRVSSFSIQGGQAGQQAGFFCVNKNCTDGAKFFWNRQMSSLPKNFNNKMSAVRLF